MANQQFKRCKKCGRIFAYRMSNYCEDCLRDMDEKYVVIRDYLYDHPNAGVHEVVEATEIEEDIIYLFLQEGRLKMKNTGDISRCEKCGRPISGGRLCESCKKAVDQLIEKGKEINERQRRVREKQAAAALGGYKSNVLKGK